MTFLLALLYIILDIRYDAAQAIRYHTVITDLYPIYTYRGSQTYHIWVSKIPVYNIYKYASVVATDLSPVS